jgi:RHS repeat-associated protein
MHSDCDKTLQTTSNLWGTSYVIDAWGNLLQKNGIPGKSQTENLTQTANTQNQFVGFCHDIAGNMLGTTGCPSLPYSPYYVYDAENRLRNLTISTSPQYLYDGDGKRVVKTGGIGNMLYWTGTGSETLTETNLSGTPTADYIYFNGKRVARVDLPAGTVRYYFSDHLGTASVVTDNLGVIKDESDYYPYGGEMVITNSDSNRYKFTGKERDSESGLDNFGARYFTSNLGRFMTPDWAARPTTVPYAVFGDPQSLNLYGYVRNDPISNFDPDGHTNPSRGESEQCNVAYCPTQCNEVNKCTAQPSQPGNSTAQKPLPPPDANHTHTLTVREVAGQQGNPAGHITVQVDSGKEVGFGPVQDLTNKQIIENTSVPGQVEPRATTVQTLDAVTIHLTKDEAAHAQGTIDARTGNPGNYQLRGRSCVDFGEAVVTSTGARAPSDTLPSHLIRDLRAIQTQDNTTQAP